MLETLCSKMTTRMLWFLIVPSALLMLALSFLVSAYAYVVCTSSEVSIEVANLRTIVKRIESIESKTHDALEFNTQSREVIEKSLDKIEKNNILTENLNRQLNLLSEQKGKLEAINQDVRQFKQELKKHEKPSKE